jgi:selT/selW/selH-like putative selenoprotein
MATDLVEGGRGQFDVELDGRLLFSKRKEHRFPEDDEILSLLRSAD